MSVPPPTAAPLSREEKQALLRRKLVERISRVRTEPASFAQERLWLLERVEGASALYVIPQALRLSGALDVAALERALGEVVRRHESLRTTFAEQDGAPVQVITPFSGFVLSVEDLSALAPAEREARARERAAEDASRPFDLAHGPLFRAALLKLGQGDHVLLLAVHHVVSDGWSMGVLYRELSALYAAFAAGAPSPLPAPRMQYAEHAAEQRARLRGDALARELAWWRERLAGAPALLELPADRPRPATRTPAGACEPIVLPASLVERLQTVARGEGATLYMLVLAAFQSLLGRYAGTDDVVVGTPVAGRTRPEVEEAIGFFVNTLVLRGDLSGDPPFREAVRRARTATLGAYAHQEVPFERLVAELQPERNAGHAPLFQVMYTLNEAAAELAHLGGVAVAPLETDGGTAKFDLTLALVPENGGMAGALEYSTDLFERGTIRRMAGHLRRLLEAVADDPDLRVSRIPLLDEDERALLLEDWNATAAGELPRATLHALFAAQAAATPDAEAVAFAGESVTYAELDARANRLAHHLAAAGVGAESRVGLCLPRGIDLVVSILAILKSGGAYVPLDADYPRERLAFMLADSGVRVLVTRESMRALLPADEAGVRAVCIDTERDAIAACPAEDPGIDTGPRGMALVFYTSGSTGTPKGVAVEHRSVVRLARGTDYLRLGADDRVAQGSNVSFDAATFEIWSALLNGAALVVLDKDTMLSPGRLADAIREHRLTTLFLTTALFNGVARERPDAFAPLAALLFGGEAADPAAVRRVMETGRPRRLLNMYGPTENATFSSWHEVDDPAAETVPIGRTVAHSTLWVLDGALQPAPIGVPGELFVGGAGVARGYLGRPAMTAERFLPDPYAGVPGARMYRTGDRVRWTAEGAVEYLARLDGQVKVRGFRIETGEIEAALRRLAGVAECLVLTRPDAAGTQQIVAYVVGDADAETLRDGLRGALPEYMVPAAFVALDALPLTPNGKVDRRALPAPDFEAGRGAYVAPRTQAEALLAEIWAGVLGVERLGVHDDFFALGGHSLLATRVISRIRGAYGVELPLRALFEEPTVAQVAARVEALRSAGLPRLAPVERVERTDAVPLSFAQERLWFLDRMEPESPFYNVPAALRLEGAIDAAALERAIGEIVRRHEALRTVFREDEGAPVQVIVPFTGFHLPVEDLSALGGEAREAAVRARAAEDAARPFDLAAGPVFRAALLRLGDAEHVLLLCIHHVASDGWSLGVLFRELWALYDAFRAGDASPLGDLPVQYADYAAWQRGQLTGQVLARQLAYWKAQLAGAPALLELPTDHPRPAVQGYAGAQVELELSADLLGRLRALGRREGATLYMVLLGAFQSLLSRYAGTTDVLVGTPVAGRTRREVEELIGLFVNTLVLRTDLSGDPGFRETLRRVRTATLGAFEHQDLPFEKLVGELRPERSLSHSPLFQVMLTLMDDARAEAAGPVGVSVRPVEAAVATTKFDLALGFDLSGGGFRALLEYNTGLFDAATAARMLRHLGRVLEQVAGDADPRLSELELLEDEERALVLGEWNRTAAAYPADACIHALFQAQAARTPDAPAATAGTETLTYAQLNARANRLAHHLRRLGVGAETRVAIGQPRGVEMLVSMLAVLKAGGAYVPLDAAYPADRLAFTLTDARVAVLLTQSALRGVLPVPDGVTVVSVDAAAEEIARESDANLPAAATARNLAYLIYTSGSTGVPKGVAITHENAVALLSWAAALHTAEELGGMLACTSICFDLSVYELFLPLSLGGRMIIVENALALPSAPAADRVRLVNTVPSAAAALLKVDGIPAGVTTINLAGEPLRTELVDALYGRGIRRVYDLYGPSEDTTYSTWTLRIAGAPATIGRPIANTQAYVLDARMRPLPAGVPGELYLAGKGLARGYLGRPSLTADRFLPDPFGAAPGGRMYRTGDRVRWTNAGTLEYLGRLDAQVKVRGYRIELGEIDTVLRRHSGVRECVVVAREDVPGEKRLAAYVAGSADAEALKAHLRQSLPEYMVPGAFVLMEALPLTPNGKIDRKALPAPDFAAKSAASLPPRNEMETRVAEVWARVLGLAAVGVSENFFDLGGTSLLLTRVYAGVKEVRADLRLVDLFRYTTVETLAAHLAAAAEPAAAGDALAGSRARAEERRALRRRKG